MTGGNRGIGLHIVKKLLRCDMTLLIGVRNPEEARKLIEGSFDISRTEGKIFYEKCDTADLESVRNFAKKVQERFSKIHILINNGENNILHIQQNYVKVICSPFFHF